MRYHADHAISHTSGRQGGVLAHGERNTKKECEKGTEGRQTWAIKGKAQQEIHKSAITNHCKRENHIMYWNMARVIRTEDNKYQRWIREAIEI